MFQLSCQYYEEPEVPQKYVCHVCRKAFRMKQHLKQHFNVHCPKKITCTVCGMKFRWKHVLKRHMERVHS